MSAHVLPPLRLTLLAAVVASVAIAQPAAAQARPAAKPKPRAHKTAEPRYDGRPLSAWISDLDGAAPLTRTSAAYAIASLGPQAVPAVPALIKALGDDVPAVRFPVAYALGEIGTGASDAVPALEKLLDDRNDDVVHIARKSLKKITGKSYEPHED